METSSINIIDLIPQRKPMVMVDKLLMANNKEIITSFEIKTDNIFVQNGKLQEVALIENIAQTAAAGTGFNSLINNEIPKKGFIGAVKNFEVFKLPKIGEILETKLIVTAEVFNASVVEGMVFCNGVLIAKGELKIFLLET
jgi:predicted hotdog family 3-hydroxylacyl-ACP dehydratase